MRGEFPGILYQILQDRADKSGICPDLDEALDAEVNVSAGLLPLELPGDVLDLGAEVDGLKVHGGLRDAGEIQQVIDERGHLLAGGFDPLGVPSAVLPESVPAFLQQQPAVASLRPERRAQVVGDRGSEARQVLVGQLDVLVPGGKCSGRAGLALFGDIAGDGSCADCGPVFVVDGRHGHGHGEGSAVLALSYRDVVRNALAAHDLSQDVRDLAAPLWRAQHRHRLADHLVRRIPIYARSALIPGQYRPVK